MCKDTGFFKGKMKQTVPDRSHADGHSVQAPVAEHIGDAIVEAWNKAVVSGYDAMCDELTHQMSRASKRGEFLVAHGLQEKLGVVEGWLADAKEGSDSEPPLKRRRP